LPASDPAALREPLQAIMREAGDLARRTQGGPFKRWSKGPDHSPVCEADIVVNDLLQARLPALLPGSGWLSEETEDHLPSRSASAVWIVDPIDGTRAFIAGRADWTISVALAHEGRPVLAALFAPVSDEMFFAAHGTGATLNGVPIHANAGESLDSARLAGPKSYLERVEHLAPGIQAEPKVHSLARRLARVAQGQFDAALASRGSHDWDLAAADLLVHEAGGVMTDFAARPLIYNRPHLAHGALIAAGSARHHALIDLVRDRQAEFA
jgi:myo-inositol-1(or 4)-monophosphatase